MGKVIISGVGGGGAGSDDCTATKNEVLKGYGAITKDSDDEVVQGTLELTGTAADSHVLAGKTYYNNDAKEKRAGAMTNRGAVSQVLNAGGSYTIPAGFHNGGGKITANSLASQTPGNASAGHILSGKTAYVNGQKVTGSIPYQNVEIANSDRAWAQGVSCWNGAVCLKVRNGHYLNGVNWIQGSLPNLQPGNIKKGVNINGIVGTMKDYSYLAQGRVAF